MVAALLWGLAGGLVVNLVHAAAQLLVARLFGVAVDRVSLGVGPTLGSRTRGPTTFRIAALPLFVVVRLRPPWSPRADGAWPPVRPTDLRSRRLPVRLAVFASGPVAVLALAFVCAYGANSYPSTAADEGTAVGDVLPGGPAARAGVQRGDVVLAVGDDAAQSWRDVTSLVGKAGYDPLPLRLRRGDTVLTLEVTPEPSPSGDRRIVGIAPRLIQVPPAGPIRRIGAAGGTVAEYAGALAARLRASVVGGEVTTMGGPTMLYVTGGPPGPAGWLVATNGVLYCLFWCLVWPYLDGRRLLFVGIEAVVRRPVHPRYEQWFNRIWLPILVVIDVLANLGELRRMLV